MMKQMICKGSAGALTTPAKVFPRGRWTLSVGALLVAALLCCTTAAFAQQGKTVKGVVVDEQSSPLIGVTVKVKGEPLGVLTGADGEFELTLPKSDVSLEIIYMGYTTQVIAASNTQALSRVVLKEEVSELGEVVVTGITSVDRRLFTGAADRLGGDDVKIDGIAEISRSLEGRAAGVSVQNVSGTFGAAPKIRVRGATSIFGSSHPMWVVDGVIVENTVDLTADAFSSGDAETLISSAISGLNPSDIEDFTILKDGSATSIYGAKAMGGVIVVTTKKGRRGSNNIAYTGEFTSRLVPTYREFNIMDSQEQMAVYKELEEKGHLNFSGTLRSASGGVYWKMYDMLSTYDAKSGTFLLQNTPAARNAYLREAEFRNTDWFQELFTSDISQSHSVSLSGGNNQTTYRGALSAMLDPGWYKSSQVRRYTAQMNIDHKILNNLSVNLNSRASFRQQRAPGTRSQEIDVVFGKVHREFDINPYAYALNTSRTLDPNTFYIRDYAPFNIKHELDNNYMDYNVLDLLTSLKINYKPIAGMELEALGAIKYTGTGIDNHRKDESNFAQAYRAMQDPTVRDNNPYLYSDPDNPYALPVSILPVGGIYERTDHKVLGYEFRANAKYNRGFVDNQHYLSLLAGLEVTATDKEKTWFRGWGRQYNMGDEPLPGYIAWKQWSEENTDYYSYTSSRERTAAFYGMATYSMFNKYVFNAVLRYEGSNRLGKAITARWLPTWNISGAWDAHEESFFKYVRPVMSHFRFRASYSLTADRGPDFVDNSLVKILANTRWKPDGSLLESSLYIDGLENQELTYEKKHELNLGFDLGFLNNRIMLQSDVYWRNMYDLIGMISVMGLGGFVDKYANVASMKSSGYEFTLTTKNIDSKDFKWTTSFIFSNNKEKITKLMTRKRIIDFVVANGFGKEGYPTTALFSIPFSRLDGNGYPLYINENHEESNTIYLQDSRNTDFLLYEGPTVPPIFGSLGNIFNYRNLRLNVYLTYSFGNRVRLDPTINYVYSDLTASPRELKNRWIMPGDEAKTNIPVIMSTREISNYSDARYAYNYYNYSDVRVADGSFVRLKEISLSYDFPKSLIQRARFKALAVKVQATNICLLYADRKLNGADPEFVNAGGVAAPMPKQFTLTLQLGL
jgi:TonB-linked SusC/RagA family outer membrane protein